MVPPACITPKGNCPTSPADPPKGHRPTEVGHRRQRNRLPGNPVLYNQTHRSGQAHRSGEVTEVFLECSNQYGLTAHLRGPRGATPETRPPVLPVGRRPRTKLSGDLNSSSGVPPKSYTSVQPRGGGTRTGTARGDPPQGGVERPDTSRFGTFSTPTCCPESSPS